MVLYVNELCQLLESLSDEDELRSRRYEVNRRGTEVEKERKNE